MDPFTMAERVLGNLEMTSDQLAQLRAINTKYFTELAALERNAGGESRAGADPARSEPASGARAMTALHAMIASDIRDLLTAQQRVVFDRNFPRVWAQEIERASERGPDDAS